MKKEEKSDTCVLNNLMKQDWLQPKDTGIITLLESETADMQWNIARRSGHHTKVQEVAHMHCSLRYRF